jgi:hypothetical protein
VSSPEEKALLAPFRTQSRDLVRWRVVDAYAAEAMDGVDGLRAFAARSGAASAIPIAQKAIASTFRVLMRADDSNGAIQSVVSELLRLHLELCRVEPPAERTLVAWLTGPRMGEISEYFALDITEYAAVLGETGVAAFVRAVEKRENALTTHFDRRPEPWTSDSERNERSILLQQFQRLAVLARDPEGIVSTHGGDQARPYLRLKAAQALVEAGFIERAIDIAWEGATDEGSDVYVEESALLWRDLIAEHEPERAADAAQWVFERWPRASSARAWQIAANDAWQAHREQAINSLRARSFELIAFLLSDGDVSRAWTEAQRAAAEGGTLSLQQWDALIEEYSAIDPVAVLPTQAQLIDDLLLKADSTRYPGIVIRMRALVSAAASAGHAEEGTEYIRAIRERYARRPSLMARMDRAKLP